MTAAGLLGNDDAAAYVGCSRATVAAAAHAGALPFVLAEGVRAFKKSNLIDWKWVKPPGTL